MTSGSQFAAMKKGKRFTGGWFLVVAVLVFGGVVLQLTQGSVLPGQDSGRVAQAAAVSATAPGLIRDDVALLINRCGRPDRDRDVGGFEPAPLVPARMLTYSKAHLKIAYVSADHDPPYHWTLMGLVDTRTNRVIDLNAFQSTLQGRLHCMLN